MRKLWRLASWRPFWRVAIILGVFIVVGSPYAFYRYYLYQFTLGRLPEPLEVEKIEFQREEVWGFGPGGNETGFIAYRLTPASADWVRRNGSSLANVLPGGSEDWQKTPITCPDERCAWRDDMTSQRGPAPSLRGYLNKYGFDIRVDRKFVDQVDQAIRTSGSVYRYNRGGGVTIVVPAQGMAYHAYAG